MFAQLWDSDLARSDWNHSMLSARAERTWAREAKRAASEGLVVGLVVVVGGGWWRGVFDEVGGMSL